VFNSRCAALSEVGSWKLEVSVASLLAWDSSTSLRSVFKCCYAAFKDLSSFDLQSQIWGFQLVSSFLNTAKQCLNAERSEAIERHEVPLEFLIAEGV
jgi:hypothetical protein